MSTHFNDGFDAPGTIRAGALESLRGLTTRAIRQSSGANGLRLTVETSRETAVP
ncbi:MAG: hypothetical protein R3C20_15090 [Planctomycetaceae bacterium]